jgi:DNA invertase Pin-like site-specific DNA recombinase
MDSELIGYARCSTDAQDLTVQHDELRRLGVAEGRIYLEHGYTGTNRSRPKLAEALAATRAGDTLVITKLDRLARSVPDARDIISGLADAGVSFQMGGTIHDWSDPFSKAFLMMLSVFAEFEADLIRMRTREGMARASREGKLKGRKPKLSPANQLRLVKLFRAGENSITDLAETFGVGRPTVYRVLDRHGVVLPGRLSA